MADPIDRFFSAWGAEEQTLQAAIGEVLAADATYADPRSDGVLQGTEAVADYLKTFGANAPGWSASVVKRDTTAEVSRVTVAFAGPGPDGQRVEQLGQYFVDTQDGKLVRLVGFVGTGSR